MPTRARILVIDDDPLFRSLIVSLLRKEFWVSVASEGSEGFYKSLEHPPDIAIVDIRMPGWDGLKTLKAFRGHPFLNEVKILIMTSDSSPDTVRAAMQGGANGYVVKTSFSKDDLYAKLRQLLPANQLADSVNPVPTDPIPAALGATVSVAPQQPDMLEPFEVSAEVAPDAADHDSADVGLQEIIDGWE